MVDKNKTENELEKIGDKPLLPFEKTYLVEYCIRNNFIRRINLGRSNFLPGSIIIRI
jgi:hypothetical protein